MLATGAMNVLEKERLRKCRTAAQSMWAEVSPTSEATLSGRVRSQGPSRYGTGYTARCPAQWLRPSVSHVVPWCRASAFSFAASDVADRLVRRESSRRAGSAAVALVDQVGRPPGHTT